MVHHFGLAIARLFPIAKYFCLLAYLCEFLVARMYSLFPSSLSALFLPPPVACAEKEEEEEEEGETHACRQLKKEERAKIRKRPWGEKGDLANVT